MPQLPMLFLDAIGRNSWHPSAVFARRTIFIKWLHAHLDHEAVNFKLLVQANTFHALSGKSDLEEILQFAEKATTELEGRPSIHREYFRRACVLAASACPGFNADKLNEADRGWIEVPTSRPSYAAYRLIVQLDYLLSWRIQPLPNGEQEVDAVVKEIATLREEIPGADRLITTEVLNQVSQIAREEVLAQLCGT